MCVYGKAVKLLSKLTESVRWVLWYLSPSQLMFNSFALTCNFQTFSMTKKTLTCMPFYVVIPLSSARPVTSLSFFFFVGFYLFI